MNLVTEKEWEWQEKLEGEGYRLIAPTVGVYRKLEDAMEVARKHPNSFIVYHTYCGRGRGYMIYSKIGGNENEQN